MTYRKNRKFYCMCRYVCKSFAYTLCVSKYGTWQNWIFECCERALHISTPYEFLLLAIDWDVGDVVALWLVYWMWDRVVQAQALSALLCSSQNPSPSRRIKWVPETERLIWQIVAVEGNNLRGDQHSNYCRGSSNPCFLLRNPYWRCQLWNSRLTTI